MKFSRTEEGPRQMDLGSLIIKIQLNVSLGASCNRKPVLLNFRFNRRCKLTKNCLYLDIDAVADDDDDTWRISR